LKNLLYVVAACITSFATCATASTVVTVRKTVDANLFQSGYTADPSTGPSYALAVGDSVEFDLSFLSGQRLTLINPIGVLGFINSTDNVSRLTTARFELSFKDLAGPAQGVPPKMAVSSGYGIGAPFSSAEFLTNANPTPVSFSGVMIRIQVVSFSDMVPVVPYLGTYFAVTAGQVQVSSVPEPSTSLLALIGLLSLGAKLRSHRAKNALW